MADVEFSHLETARLVSNLGSLVVQLQARMEKNEDRFEKHLEIYAKNNKELALVAERIKAFNESFANHDKLEREREEKMFVTLEKLSQLTDTFDWENARSVVDTYRSVISMRNIVVGLASVVVAVGSIGAGVLFVFKKLW